MERRRTPFRRARLAGVALLVVAAATACNGAGPVGRGPAATVNGHDITLDDVRDLMDAQERFYEDQKKTAPDGADTSELDGLLGDLRGSGADTLGTEGAAAALNQLITYQAVVDDLAKDGVKITEADRKTVRDGLIQQVGTEADLKKLDQEFLDFTIETQAATLALKQQVEKTAPVEDREPQIQALYEQAKIDTPLCLNVILAADDAAAEEALSRVEGGEDFATVAQELSQDPQSAEQGGYAGCGTAEVAAASFPADYADVAKGDLLGPIANDAGPVVVQIASTTGPELEQIRPDLEAQLDEQLAQGGASDAALSERIDRLLADADVQVDERYGTWDPGTPATDTTPGRPPAVIPPADPGITTASLRTSDEGTITVDPATGAPTGS